VGRVSALEQLQQHHPGTHCARKRQCKRERTSEPLEDSAFRAVTLQASVSLEDESTHCFVPSLFLGSTMPGPWAWSKPLVPAGALPTWIRWKRTERLPSRTRNVKWSPFRGTTKFMERSMLEPGASVPLSSVPPTGANSRPLR